MHPRATAQPSPSKPTTANLGLCNYHPLILASRPRIQIRIRDYPLLMTRVHRHHRPQCQWTQYQIPIQRYRPQDQHPQPPVYEDDQALRLQRQTRPPRPAAAPPSRSGYRIRMSQLPNSVVTAVHTHAHGTCMLTPHISIRRPSPARADPARQGPCKPCKSFPSSTCPTFPASSSSPPASRVPVSVSVSVRASTRPSTFPSPSPSPFPSDSPFPFPSRARARILQLVPVPRAGRDARVAITIAHRTASILPRSARRLDPGYWVARHGACSAAPPAVNPSARARALSLAAYPASSAALARVRPFNLVRRAHHSTACDRLLSPLPLPFGMCMRVTTASFLQLPSCHLVLSPLWGPSAVARIRRRRSLRTLPTQGTCHTRQTLSKRRAQIRGTWRVVVILVSLRHARHWSGCTYTTIVAVVAPAAQSHCVSMILHPHRTGGLLPLFKVVLSGAGRSGWPRSPFLVH